jgi:hypothetical protein
LQFTGELDVVLGNSVIINLERGRAAVGHYRRCRALPERAR